MSSTLLTILTDEAARDTAAVEQLLMGEAQVAAPWVSETQ